MNTTRHTFSVTHCDNYENTGNCKTLAAAQSLANKHGSYEIFIRSQERTTDTDTLYMVFTPRQGWSFIDATEDDFAERATPANPMPHIKAPDRRYWVAGPDDISETATEEDLATSATPSEDMPNLTFNHLRNISETATVYKDLLRMITDSCDPAYAMRVKDELDTAKSDMTLISKEELVRVSHIFFDNTKKWVEFCDVANTYLQSDTIKETATVYSMDVARVAGRDAFDGIDEQDICERASQIITRRMERDHEAKAFTSPQLVTRYLQATLAHLEHEEFHAMIMDSQHRLIKCVRLAVGTIDGAAVYPREVMKTVLKYNGAAVIFAHNHPSGIADASGADKSITARLCEALKMIDVRVLDHVIVGHGEFTSFAEKGWL